MVGSSAVVGSSAINSCGALATAMAIIIALALAAGQFERIGANGGVRGRGCRPARISSMQRARSGAPVSGRCWAMTSASWSPMRSTGFSAAPASWNTMAICVAAQGAKPVLVQRGKVDDVTVTGAEQRRGRHWWPARSAAGR